jgi:hypothetical protein
MSLRGCVQCNSTCGSVQYVQNDASVPSRRLAMCLVGGMLPGMGRCLMPVRATAECM